VIYVRIKAGLERQQVEQGIEPFVWVLKCIMGVSVAGCFCDAVFM